MVESAWFKSFVDRRSVRVAALLVFAWACGMLMFMPRGRPFLASYGGWKLQHGIRPGAVFWKIEPTTHDKWHIDRGNRRRGWFPEFLGFSAALQTRDVMSCSGKCCVVTTAYGEIAIPAWFLLAVSGYISIFRPSQGALRDFGAALRDRLASSEF